MSPQSHFHTDTKWSHTLDWKKKYFQSTLFPVEGEILSDKQYC